jgi:hypothetical protein
MRYLISAKLRTEKRGELLAALEGGRFGEGFPYSDLGEVLCAGRVDESGTIRWVEVCYCREYYGVAMEEELPYLEEYLTDVTIADARSPRYCEGYPVCNDCDCTKKVRFRGEPFLSYLLRSVRESAPVAEGNSRPTLWLGWRGRMTPEEAERNLAGSAGDPG